MWIADLLVHGLIQPSFVPLPENRQLRDLTRLRLQAPHQKHAVWRILQGGSPLLVHVVGAAKTWTMTAAAMELRRLDLAKETMFVVPNHLVDQWAAETPFKWSELELFCQVLTLPSPRLPIAQVSRASATS